MTPTELLEPCLGFLAGAFCWTFLEYALHNWVGHLGRGRNAFSRHHLQHHGDPRYYAPTRAKVLVATPAVLGVGLLAAALGPWQRAVAFAVGLAALYVAYEVLHRRTHTHAPIGPYGRWARRHHMAHHFCNPNMNHGVTTPLWDVVFGTYLRPGVIPVLPKKAMDWLCDPESGEVHERYRAHYRLHRPGVAAATAAAAADRTG